MKVAAYVNVTEEGDVLGVTVLGQPGNRVPGLEVEFLDDGSAFVKVPAAVRRGTGPGSTTTLFPHGEAA